LLTAEKFERIRDGFDYLLNLPIASLTLKHAQKHEKDLADLKAQIVDLESKNAKSLWLSDLSNLKF
jgi:hypothetical protein